MCVCVCVCALVLMSEYLSDILWLFLSICVCFCLSLYFPPSVYHYVIMQFYLSLSLSLFLTPFMLPFYQSIYVYMYMYVHMYICMYVWHFLCIKSASHQQSGPQQTSSDRPPTLCSSNSNIQADGVLRPDSQSVPRPRPQPNTAPEFLIMDACRCVAAPWSLATRLALVSQLGGVCRG